jgi:DNA methylase/Protein of unknown function (DUF5131)
MRARGADWWWDATWNPVGGCLPISPGCQNCYAAQVAGTKTWPYARSAGVHSALCVKRFTLPFAGQATLAQRQFLGENDMMAYLTMMAVRLLELHRVLKPTGSLYLHCDPKASHYLKLLLDAVFGPDKFLNEVIWKRTSAHGSSKRFGPVHDIILFCAKTDDLRLEPRWIG